MKSADPNVVYAITTTLDKTPIDTAAIISHLTDENKDIVVSTILDAYIDVSNALKENTTTLKAVLAKMEERERITDAVLKKNDQTIRRLQGTEVTNVTITSLAKFFLYHEDLLEDYSIGEDNLVYFKGKLLDTNTDTLLYLSIDLEQFFGNKHIGLSTLLNAVKRYLIAKKKQANYYQDALLDIVEDFFKQGVGRPKIRVPLKYLRDACKDVPELDMATIKALMYDAGFPIKTDKNGIVYFYKVD